jgi:hypothetical protein
MTRMHHDVILCVSLYLSRSVCSKVVGAKQVSLNELYECRVVRKARRIVNDSSHVLAQSK